MLGSENEMRKEEKKHQTGKMSRETRDYLKAANLKAVPRDEWKRLNTLENREAVAAKRRISKSLEEKDRALDALVMSFRKPRGGLLNLTPGGVTVTARPPRVLASEKIAKAIMAAAAIVALAMLTCSVVEYIAFTSSPDAIEPEPVVQEVPIESDAGRLPADAYVQL